MQSNKLIIWLDLFLFGENLPKNPVSENVKKSWNVCNEVSMYLHSSELRGLCST